MRCLRFFLIIALMVGSCSNTDQGSNDDNRFSASVAENPYAIMDMPLDVTMELKSLEDGIATLVIDNHSGEEITYGERYSMYLLQGEEWYQLPIVSSNAAFTDVGCILQDMEQAEVTCDLNIFGELAPGTYRLEKDGLTAEFTIDALCGYPEAE